MSEKLRVMMMMIAVKNTIWFTFPSNTFARFARINTHTTTKAHSEFPHTDKHLSIITHMYKIHSIARIKQQMAKIALVYI